MRLKNLNHEQNIELKSQYKIICIDDEPGVLSALKIILERYGYIVEGYADHLVGIEKIKCEKYDLLILDYLLDKIKADKVVQAIREFNKELYILLLTGHSDSAPPIETLENNAIQGYCTKSADPTQLILMVKSGIRAIELMNEIKTTRDSLRDILSAIPEIYMLQPIDNILDKILNGILPIVKTSNAFVIVDNLYNSGEISNKTFFSGTGKFNVNIDEISNVFYPEIMNYAGIARTTLKTVSFEEGIFVPLISEENICIGLIYFEISNPIEKSLLEIFSSQASSAINNAFLHSLINIKNDQLVKTYEIMKIRFEETIDTLRLTVDAKDEYTKGHSDRVSYYAVEIGKLLGALNDGEIELLRIGGIFHDIGKIGTADDILQSPNKLSEIEYKIIQKHPMTGANILSALSMFNNVVPIVKYHHERIDGTGYPEGLHGNEIPLFARIVAIADAFDAMTSNRVYRNKINVEQTLELLNKFSGTQFDAEIVQIFIDGIRNNVINVIE